MVLDDAKPRMRDSLDGTGGAGKHDYAASQSLRVSHQRRDLHGAIALVQVNTPWIHHYGNATNRTYGRLEAVACHWPR